MFAFIENSIHRMLNMIIAMREKTNLGMKRQVVDSMAGAKYDFFYTNEVSDHSKGSQ